MRRPIPVPLLLASTLFGLAASAAPGDPESAEGTAADPSGIRLRWRNGDEISGRLLDAPAGRVAFAVPAFEGPFDLDPAQLSGLRFPAPDDPPASESPTPPFELVLKNGDRLHGRLLSIDRERLGFQCLPLEAPLRIRMTEVLRLSRLDEAHLGISGLGDLDDWTSSGRDRKPSDWQSDLRGEFETHQWSGNLFREIALPERVEVRFRAHFPGGLPHLEVGLLREPHAGPMLETWDRNLVLTHRNRFAPVMKVDESTRDLALRLFWDQGSGKSILCDASGKQLATLQGETPREKPLATPRRSDPLHRGFSILSRNPAMRLLSLEIREWDGKPVPVIDPARPRLIWRDGGVAFPGSVTLAPDSTRLRLDGSTHSLDELDDWILATEESPDSDRGARVSTRVAWSSGSSVSGAFVALGKDGIQLQPSWSESPLLASLDGAREVQFPDNSEALESGSDTLALDSLTLRGSATLAPQSAGLLAWRPPGASAAVALTGESAFTIHRGRELRDGAEVSVGLGMARLYLESDEILTGELLGVAEEKVRFRSRVTGEIEIAANQIRAIDTGTTGRILEGFRDPEWEVIEEVESGAELEGDTAIVRTGGFGNPSILLGDRIRFDIAWKESYGAMTLRFFAAGADADSPSTDVVIAAQGNRLFLGRLNGTGSFSFSGDQIPIADNRASLDISARPEEIEIRVNGRSSLKLKVAPDQISGNGLYFRAGGGWQGWNQAESVIAISHFRIDSSPGHVPRRVIDPFAKARSLAIPRSQRDHPPTHLLIAPNGDLLRGRLRSIDGSSVRFHSQGAELELPRSRISHIVRLRAPLPAPASPGAAPEPDRPPAEAKGKAADLGLGFAESDSDLEAFPEADPDAPSDGGGSDPALREERRGELAAYRALVSHTLVLRDGTRLRLDGRGAKGPQLAGQSPVLGSCLVSLEQVREITRTPPRPLEDAPPLDVIAFADWRAVFTPDPSIPEAGEPDSPLVGLDAPDFELARLDDSTFRLSEHRGSVVVLDFWTTWSGPSAKAMPESAAAVAAFPPGSVTHCAVNQGETPPIVSSFLEAREWQDVPVALDFDLKVGTSYRVEGLPHTVVIDPQGKIAWVQSGFREDWKEKLFEAIARALRR